MKKGKEVRVKTTHLKCPERGVRGVQQDPGCSPQPSTALLPFLKHTAEALAAQPSLLEGNQPRRHNAGKPEGR